MRTRTFGQRTWRALAVLVALGLLVTVTGTAGAQETTVDDSDLVPYPVSLDAWAASDDAAGPAVIGGKQAKLKDHPYYVLVTNPQGTQICGGTLIRKRWILTAAHCIDDKGNRGAVIVFGYDRASNKYADAVQSDRVIVHPKWNGQGNDIGLVRIQRNPKLSSPLIKPTGFNTKASKPKVGSKQLLVGYGLTRPQAQQPAKHLQKVRLPIKSCTGIFGESNKEAICAGGGPVSACYGDSGGPLMAGKKVAGVVSGGADPCGSSYGVFTRVSYYSKWIKKTMRKGRSAPDELSD